MTKKKSSFRDKVANNSHKQKTQGAAYGYLRIPKGIDMFKEEPSSRVSLDFLPYRVTSEKHMDRDDSLGIAIPGELWYKRPFLIHRNIGGGNDVVVCPTSIGKKCPICEYRAKLFKDGASKEETDALKTSRRNLYVVVPIGHKEYEEKPHLWDISQYLFQEMLNDEIEDNPENAIFPDLEDGLTLRIRFSEGSIGTNKFAEASRIDFKEREEGYGEKILKKVPNLDECLLIHPYAKLEKMFLELEDDDDASDSDLEDDENDSTEDSEETMEEEIEGEKCIACGGTGENSKGGVCRICKGTGIKLRKKEDEDEKEKEKERKNPPTRRQRKSQAEEEEAEENPCPFGHVFGADCEKYPECDDCDKWDECIDAQDIDA